MRIAVLAASVALLAACSGPAESPLPSPGSPASSEDTTMITTTPEPSGPERFLAQLHAQGVPTSKTGQPEIQIGTGICQQLARDADPRALARDLTAIGWTQEQGTAIVTAAQAHLC